MPTNARRGLPASALMMLSVFMFSFGDALGKYMVATYSVGQLLWLRACAALLVLLPLVWRDRRAFTQLERPWLQLLRVVLSTLEVAAFFLATVYLPLADVITYYLACPIFVTALSAIVLREQVGWRRWSAIADRLLRRADRAAAFGADHQLAGDDRARRQPVVCGPDADHPLAAGDAGYRAGVVAIRRHLPLRRADVAVRLGDAELGSLGLFAAAGCISVSALLCVNRSLKLAPASVVVPYQYSMIIWAVMFGYVVFGDVPSMATIVGAAIIIGAGLYIFLRERELGRGRGRSVRRSKRDLVRVQRYPRRQSRYGRMTHVHGVSSRATLPRRTAPVLQRRPDAARQAEAVDRGRGAQRLEAVQFDAAPLEAAFLQDVA